MGNDYREWNGQRLTIRPGTSDAASFRQVFVDRCFSPLLDVQDVRFVVDCGANVGFSSVWFLETFTDCQLLAVEPDPGNFAALIQNMKPYLGRVFPRRAALWPQCEPLVVEPGRYRDGREWSTQVRSCAVGECRSCAGLDIPALVEGYPNEWVDILKIDIEGAEAKVFAGNCDWLDRIRTIAIELHDDSQFGPATPVFEKAIAGRGFRVEQHGELTICRRI